MAENEVRYVKLENNEGILAKRYFLSTQMNLLRILRAINGYHALRLKELKIKTGLLNSIKEISQNVRKIEMNIPKLTTSHSFIKDKESGKLRARETREAIRPGGDRDLEIQLRDIQEKLRALQG
ncbi:MAG: hypothetical protein AABY15_03555 [Nanoarchaeota archaeon]